MTLSLLPALVGTTLPFWLRPPDFSFNWIGAVEFLIATVLIHTGFSFLYARFEERSTAEWPKSRLLRVGCICIIAACLLGLHLNSSVPGSIFIVCGVTSLFAGVLYVAPPFSFCRRVSGEVVISVILGMVPVLGAYLVQTGDLTRTVYLASMPLVVATVLWVCTGELVTSLNDEKAGRGTMVILFGPRFSGRFVVLSLSILLYVTLSLAVFSASINPLVVVAVLSIGFAWRIVSVSWHEYTNPERMRKAHLNSFKLHFATCIIIAASSLAALFS